MHTVASRIARDLEYSAREIGIVKIIHIRILSRAETWSVLSPGI